MQPDVRDTPLYSSVADLLRRLGEPFGTVATFADPSPSPDGSKVAFTGTRRDAVDTDAVSRVCLLDVADGTVEEITAGPHDDRSPRWSPDGTAIAFLSDRKHPGRYGLFLLESGRLGEAWSAPEVEGSVEWLSWSPDGAALLLGVAGAGAEKSGVEGSGRVKDGADRPDWLPAVTTADTSTLWRKAFRYDVRARTLTQLSRDGLNVWEAVWCGTGAIAAVVSESPDEGAWYDAPLALIDAATGTERVLHRGRNGRQLGWPAATPDGSRLAVVEARCSDRWVVAGDVLLVDPATGDVTAVDTAKTDVTALQWRDGTRLAYLGQRGLDSVVGEHDAASGTTDELWCGAAAPPFGMQPALLPDGTMLVELSAWDRPAQVAALGKGVDRTVHVFAAGQGVDPASLGREERVRWTASDGLEIEGLLYRPNTEAPHPTVLYVHGGPIGREFTRSPGRQRFMALLLDRGYAVLVPNVRGSSGRGQEYAELVAGDMGGGETGDHLAGLGALVERGIVDPQRIGVMGGSHGGFMTTWLVTQAPERFAAAVAISPVTDWRSQHFTSNIAHFDALFVGAMDDAIRDERSPLLHAHKVRTPTFLTAGDVDRCTPPGQALEFHQALLENGVPAACAIYPGEGHGVRRYPAVLDWMTRIVGWFEEWMPA
jgi:dipeptidyl aminopeptidase/acylaminoacyl peptidase